MLPVDTVVVAGAEGFFGDYPVAAFVIAVLSFTCIQRFFYGLLFLFIKGHEKIFSRTNSTIRLGNHGAGIGKSRDNLAIVGFAMT